MIQRQVNTIGCGIIICGTELSLNFIKKLLLFVFNIFGEKNKNKKQWNFVEDNSSLEFVQRGMIGISKPFMLGSWPVQKCHLLDTVLSELQKRSFHVNMLSASHYSLQQQELTANK